MKQSPVTARNLEQSANKAIQILRKKKLQQGLPFMINSDILESNQCFLEYPDGSLKIVEADSRGLDFRVVMDLSASETKQLKKRLNLL